MREHGTHMAEETVAMCLLTLQGSNNNFKFLSTSKFLLVVTYSIRVNHYLYSLGPVI
jgi:hypothetical protein